MAALLALDLGQSLGWCLGGAVGPLRVGTFTLKPTTELGPWLRSADPFFREMLPQCEALAVEQPIVGGG